MWNISKEVAPKLPALLEGSNSADLKAKKIEKLQSTEHSKEDWFVQL